MSANIASIRVVFCFQHEKMSAEEQELLKECAKLLQVAQGSKNIAIQINSDPKALNCTVTLPDEKTLHVVSVLGEILAGNNSRVDNEIYEKAATALQSINVSTDRLLRIGIKTCEVCEVLVESDYIQHLE